MTYFEILVIVFLYLIWAQNSLLVNTLAKWLTRKRRRFINGRKS
jgi:hypothetical protein